MENGTIKDYQQYVREGIKLTATYGSSQVTHEMIIKAKKILGPDLMALYTSKAENIPVFFLNKRARLMLTVPKPLDFSHNLEEAIQAPCKFASLEVV